MNNQTPGRVYCWRQPELRRPAGWFAAGLCPRMKSPWPGATLPWQWVGRQGPAVKPRGQGVRMAGRCALPCMGVASGARSPLSERVFGASVNFHACPGLGFLGSWIEPQIPALSGGHPDMVC